MVAEEQLLGEMEKSSSICPLTETCFYGSTGLSCPVACRGPIASYRYAICKRVENHAGGAGLGRQAIKDYGGNGWQ